MYSQPADSFRLSEMRATPYPNRLLELSVTLPETQARVMNLIVRLTLGWHSGSPGQRKSTTLLSLWQVTKRVRRSSVIPVAEAVAALARSGVIGVWEADGSPVDLAGLAGSRRRPLMFGLCRVWVEETQASKPVDNRA